MFTILVLTLALVHVFSAPIEDDEELRGFDLSHLGERIFSKPLNSTGKKLETWDPKSESNPEEQGEYAEGDILFPSESRNGLIAQSFRWKDGVIPYEITGSFNYNEMNMINRAMGIYHKYTCITFRPRRSGDTDYISIVNGPTGCWSSVGRVSGMQKINLQSPYCLTKVGTPVHELMHAVGFLHEQNRYERDSYISIAWQNIQRGHDNNFDKASKDTTNGFGVPYDFKSVMHYSKTAFSVNGQPTIIPKDPGNAEKMGQRDGFSRGDILKINTMYGCPEKTPGYVESSGGSSSSNNNNNNNNNNNHIESNNNNHQGNTAGNVAANIIDGLLSIFTGRDEETES